MKKYFTVQTASAKMPANCWGRYGKVAVLELNDGFESSDVTMISERAKAVKRIVALWDKLNIGKTDRCAFAIAEAEAWELCDELNDQEELFADNILAENLDAMIA